MYSIFEPKTRRLLGQILLEVDDFIIAALPEHYDKLQKQMQDRFTFGKWEVNEAEFAGRHIRCTPEAIYIDQHKYIQEQVHPIALPKGRRQQAKEPVSDDEFTALRSLIYRINWVGRETRPEAAGLASIMASKLKHAKVEDILLVNKFVNYLRSTSDRAIKIWAFDPREMAFVVFSDAGGINTKGSDLLDEEGLPTDSTQGAWLVLATEKLPHGQTEGESNTSGMEEQQVEKKGFLHLRW